MADGRGGTGSAEAGVEREVEGRRIVFACFDGVEMLDVTGPWEVFHTAGLIAGRAPDLSCLTPGGRDVRSSSGLTIRSDGDLGSAEAAGLDTLVVPGGVGTERALADGITTEAIARLAARARRTASVCTGAYLLAEAGVLDGRRATTHWVSCADLAARYPDVEVDPDPIFIADGDVYTSAGVTSGMDLALALVEQDAGPEVALQTARMLVVYARRPGGQAQFSVQLSHQMANREPVRELQAWIGEHLDEDLSVGALAARVHLSQRQFARVFARQLGTTPADYVEQARVERARSLLESGTATLDLVARRCGFAGAEVMRRAFQRRLGTSPSEYRKRFRPPLAA
jgi:transcriptional regulator GlxA family with amidase domain